MNIAETIEQKLRQNFQITSLDVINESHMHAGHAGDNGTGESHFRIRMLSPDFDGKTRLQQHRAINDVLKDELAGPVHALAIDIGRSL